MSGTVCHLCDSMYLTLTMKAYFSDIVYTGGRTSFLMPFAFVIVFFHATLFLPLISLRDELFRDFSYFLLCLQVLYIKSAQFLVPQPQYPYCHDLYPFPHPVSASGREYLFFCIRQSSRLSTVVSSLVLIWQMCLSETQMQGEAELPPYTRL